MPLPAVSWVPTWSVQNRPAPRWRATSCEFIPSRMHRWPAGAADASTTGEAPLQEAWVSLEALVVGGAGCILNRRARWRQATRFLLDFSLRDTTGFQKKSVQRTGRALFLLISSFCAWREDFVPCVILSGHGPRRWLAQPRPSSLLRIDMRPRLTREKL